MGCGYAVCAMLAVIGMGLFFLAEAKWREGQGKAAASIAGVGGFFCVTAIGLIAPMQRAVARAKERRQREDARPNEPWTWEPAWTERDGIPQSGRRNGSAFLIIGVMTLAFSLPVVLASPTEIARGNYGVLAGWVFPIAGVSLLSVAAIDVWRRRKYGLARFVPAAVPIPLGSDVAGMVVIDHRVVALAPGRVSLDCFQTSVTRTGSKRSQREEVVAHAERDVLQGEWTVAGEETRLFVQLPIPNGAATTLRPLADGQPTYEWRLRVATPTAGADFRAEFVLPVFEVAGAQRVTEQPTSETRRAKRAEIFHAAEIREEAQPGATRGTALVFPRGQGRAVAMGPMIMTAFFGVVAVILWFTPVPKVFAAFLALFAIIPALALKALLTGGGEHVAVEGDVISVMRGQRQVRRIALAEIHAVEFRLSVGVGTRRFHRVVAVGQPADEKRRFPRRIEIAAMVRGDEAAAEVVAWLEERLARPRR